ncbi:MAG: hypothetical protein M0P58_06990 [Bacteroidales bacterium]|nr:hypothetical protein [Bacteroidales bacterium]
MKKIPGFLFSAGIMVSFTVLFFNSCTKEGPQGPPGAAGSDGKDANSNCIQCHNWSDSLVTKIFQYNASRHATGSTTGEGAQTACAPCHTSQGFLEVLTTGKDTTNAPVYDAAPINCRTCHKIHNTYSSDDWALQNNAVIAFNAKYDPSVSIDLNFNGGSSNLCARCHQALRTTPWLTNPTSITDSLEPTSSLWGPHNGTQGLILAGKGAFEIGATAFGQTDHKSHVSCASCHQALARGNVVGGHSLWMSNEVENIQNVSACIACHSGATSFDVGGKQTEIAGLIKELKTKLAIANMLDTNTMLLKTGKKYSQKQLAVYWNFMMVEADRSLGVHNYLYTHDVLQSGINYFRSRGY